MSLPDATLPDATLPRTSPLSSYVRSLVRRAASREVITFLGVGGTGYIIDVAAFNALRALHPFDVIDPAFARTLAVMVAMFVTYVGNRFLTWGNAAVGDRRREVALFVLFNVVGFGFSVVTLLISHDLLGLTSPLADNISANVIGMALGTGFRFWSYRRYVFASEPPKVPVPLTERV